MLFFFNSSFLDIFIYFIYFSYYFNYLDLRGFGVLGLIQYWSLKDHRHLDLKTLVTFYDYAVFDANEMLHYELPKCLPEIEKVVKDHSPVIGRVIYRAKNNDSLKQYTGGKMEDIFWACSHKLGDDLLKYDNALDPFSKQYRMTGFYGEFWDECDNEKPEMKIYVFYGNKKELNYPSAFDKMLRGNKFVTHSIVFDVNQSTIKPESAVFLKQLSSWLKVNAHVNLIVSGHTDNAGDSTANLKLSLARADEVKRQLVDLGIDSVRLTTKGCGASQPVQSNNTPLGKARNRRVEFVKQ